MYSYIFSIPDVSKICSVIVRWNDILQCLGHLSIISREKYVFYDPFDFRMQIHNFERTINALVLRIGALH